MEGPEHVVVRGGASQYHYGSVSGCALFALEAALQFLGGGLPDPPTAHHVDSVMRSAAGYTSDRHPFLEDVLQHVTRYGVALERCGEVHASVAQVCLVVHAMIKECERHPAGSKQWARCAAVLTGQGETLMVGCWRRRRRELAQDGGRPTPAAVQVWKWVLFDSHARRGPQELPGGGAWWEAEADGSHGTAAPERGAAVHTFGSARDLMRYYTRLRYPASQQLIGAEGRGVPGLQDSMYTAVDAQLVCLAAGADISALPPADYAELERAVEMRAMQLEVESVKRQNAALRAERDRLRSENEQLLSRNMHHSFVQENLELKAMVESLRAALDASTSSR